MKKHDEGYVLTLVLVVILVITLVGTAIMTGATRNIVAQHNSVEQMKDQYAAEGEIEKVIANLENMPNEEAVLDIFTGTNATCIESSLSEDETILTLKIEAKEKTTKIICVLELTSDAKIQKSGTENSISYKITNPSYKYISYEVVSVDNTKETTAETTAATTVGGEAE